MGDSRVGGCHFSSNPWLFPSSGTWEGPLGQSDGPYRLLNMKEQSRVDTAARTKGEAGRGQRRQEGADHPLGL